MRDLLLHLALENHTFAVWQGEGLAVAAARPGVLSASCQPSAAKLSSGKSVGMIVRVREQAHDQNTSNIRSILPNT